MSSQDQVPAEHSKEMSDYTLDSPNWSRSTKVIVTVGFLLVIIGLAYRFQGLIYLVAMAAILAYIMNPVIDLIDRHTMFSRSTGILLMYLIFALAFISASIALGVAAFEQVTTLIAAIPRLIRQVTDFFRELSLQPDPIIFGPIEINPATVDWRLIQDQVLGFVEPIVSRGTQMATEVAAATLRIFSNILFIFVISIYLAIEIPRLGGHIGNLAQQPGYRRDAERLMRGFGRIWSAYLRGQVVLGLVIFLVVWLGLEILGVQNALALGLLSGLLEFIPILGPFIGAAAAVIVAFFQPETIFALAHWQYAGLVLAYMFMVQQLENSFLVPRIVGDALELHPLWVMLAVFMGSSLAGILGAILAAPVVATIKLLGGYAWRKMFDLPPFSDGDDDDEVEQPSYIARVRTMVVERLAARRRRLAEMNKRPSAATPRRNISPAEEENDNKG